ncbi:LCP family protein [Actinocorallia aurantiaca]|uniref:Cell envelope-related transcriptional attenuator domain-containing protein n=1 Tax=Actinocorallia aurantiaca TaxID=46204 RepID=A0ABN3TW19_9ACTN
MDDLQMLRDLGHDLEHEPPASLDRQRNRINGPRSRRWTRPKGWLVLGVAAAVTASALLVPRLLLSTEMDYLDVLEDPGSVTEPKPTKDVNILVLGSDSRGGRNQKEADRFARSDTIIVAHVPADGRGVKMVSIPRDTLVDVPDCKNADGRTVPGSRAVINVAFTIGGAECARKTVENLGGITLDHTIVFDFIAFKRVVDALGGVEVEIETEIRDPEAKLSLHKGLQTLKGEQALGYVRARRGLGDGSDLGRIKRQQEVMEAVVEKSEPLLGDPAKAMDLAKAVAPALKEGQGLTVSRMLQIVFVFAQSGDHEIDFLTVPWKPDPEEPDRLVLKQPEAEKLWQTLR